MNIQPKSTGATAVSFIISGSVTPSGRIRAYPAFFDATGKQLPLGAIPLVPPAHKGDTEPRMLETAINATPRNTGEATTDHWTRAGAAVIVQTRGVQLLASK